MSDTVKNKYKKIIRWYDPEKSVRLQTGIAQGLPSGILITYQNTDYKGKKQEKILLTKYYEEEGFMLYLPRWDRTGPKARLFYDVITVPAKDALDLARAIFSLLRKSFVETGEAIINSEVSINKKEHEAPPPSKNEVDDLMGQLERMERIRQAGRKKE